MFYLLLLLLFVHLVVLLDLAHLEDHLAVVVGTGLGLIEDEGEEVVRGAVGQVVLF